MAQRQIQIRKLELVSLKKKKGEIILSYSPTCKHILARAIKPKGVTSPQ